MTKTSSIRSLLTMLLACTSTVGAVACADSTDDEPTPAKDRMRAAYESRPVTVSGLGGFDHVPIELDGPDGYLLSGSTIVHVDREAGEATTIYTASDVVMEKLALDATHLYVATDVQLFRVPRSGGAREVLVAREEGNFRALEVSDGRVYYVTGYRLASVPVTGGEVTTLATLSRQDEVRFPVQSMVLTDDGIYVASTPQVASAHGLVLRVPYEGGEPTVVRQGEFAAYHIAGDATGVYWTSSEDLPQIGIPSPTNLFLLRHGASEPEEVAAISTDGAFVVNTIGFYWADYQNSVIRAVPHEGQSEQFELIETEKPPVKIAADERGIAWTEHDSSNGSQTVRFLPRKQR